ncbi:helix-turn-helix domain-containing protein [Isoptericola halotolerans]|uniref:DNA-binding transcriptional ArsR family regulator n=1 Tax=Isoptericola halotolerans TaxID=300560 RepID=A0ABX2A0H3_9MICO|nr:helix-turn-helix domain-containing protein [Isoptericola halotolerans]NOV96359.1 DNA-binding transcriptional ArsR family regulator [Isoptericola halotolerans]
MDETFLVQSPEALKAIAHPVRQRILLQLAVSGHARAADLAAAISEPANSVSFHLRTLARAGMVVEAPEHARDKRDRVWRNVASSYQVDPETPGAADQALRPATAWLQELIGRASTGRRPDEDGRQRLLVLNNLPLTAEEAQRFSEELVDLQKRWTDRVFETARAEPSEAREVYQLLLALGPRQEQDADGAPTTRT